MVREEIPAILVLHEFDKNRVDREAYKVGIRECRGCFDCSINHIKNIFTSFSWESVFTLRYSIFPIEAENRVSVDHFAEILYGI